MLWMCCMAEASKIVPTRETTFYKFRYQELNILKETSIASDNIWKAAGKPRSGRIYQNRNVGLDRNAYREKITGQKSEISSYTNDLREALLEK